MLEGSRSAKKGEKDIRDGRYLRAQEWEKRWNMLENGRDSSEEVTERKAAI